MPSYLIYEIYCDLADRKYSEQSLLSQQLFALNLNNHMESLKLSAKSDHLYTFKENVDNPAVNKQSTEKTYASMAVCTCFKKKLNKPKITPKSPKLDWPELGFKPGQPKFSISYPPL